MPALLTPDSQFATLSTDLPARTGSDPAAAIVPPCANRSTCSASMKESTPAAYLIPCPMTCVGVKFQDLRWN